MRAVLQRVSRAAVHVEEECTGSIQSGLVVFLGVEEGDTEEDLVWLATKITKLRIFEDEHGKMNRALEQMPDGGVLVVSQFTLLGTIRKGTRPSFNRAAAPERANELYQQFLEALDHTLGRQIETGRFAADMRVSVENNGPVTLVLDSRRKDF